MISFPALPGSGDYSVENIFGQLCDDNGVYVLGEGEACFCDDSGNFYGTLQEVSQDDAYWVIIDIFPAILVIEDAVPVSYDADGEVVYEIHYGINLISYPFQTDWLTRLRRVPRFRAFSPLLQVQKKRFQKI